ncbi:hypothetical protein VDG1235_1765 [Verrucomicrobiia bacterium DG1235]|nr:hypothetical protein VDG1235_1765 [Verrucomicrobiae bacterium DG1235]
MEAKERNCLVIPDVHQHIRWVDAILEKEATSAERIVFLGDYFDAKHQAAASPAETARYISSLSKAYPKNRFSFLVGNHDLAYLYDFQNLRGKSPVMPNPYSCSNYMLEESPSISKNLSPAFVASLEPFTFASGYLLSHAGLHLSFYETASNPKDEKPLDSLYRKLKAELKRLPKTRMPELAAVGFVREGRDPVGGLTWQDWHREFEDDLPWPQIVGHTILAETQSKGRSWNLDTRSGNYAILSPGGIEIKDQSKDLR